jgi:hypothetical protein
MARKELTYDATHPAYVELQAEADALGITVQQRIHLIIVGRYNVRHELPYDAALWLPGVPVSCTAPPTPPADTAGAQALAEQWL